MPLASSNQTGRKNWNFERPKTFNFITRLGNQGGWGLSVSLNGCNFEHTELSVHFGSFNDECAIEKEAKDANLLSQESKLTRVK